MNGLWDKMDPGFLAPVWLGIGLLAMLAVLLLEIGARRRRRNAIRQFAASHLIASLTSGISPSKRLLKSALLVSAVGLLFVAMARPHLFYDWRDENRTGLDLLLAVDCSKSMLTEDVAPNRLERAKLAIADFADRLPENRLGLIAFAGDAFLQCPMTLDHDAFQSAVRELDTDTIPRPGTDLASAIDEAIDALRSQPNNLKFLILITDGEDLEGRVLDSARTAAQNGIKIYTVGVGTAAGGLIPERDDNGMTGYHHDQSGQIVQSKLDEGTLRQIANLTGGAYVPLGQRGEGLDEIYSRYIASLPKRNIEERREKILFERFEWPLALALIFLVWEFLTTERGRSPSGPVISSASLIPARRPARRKTERAAATVASLVTLALLLSSASPASAKSNADKAEKAYTKGDYENALENYRRAAEENPDRSDLQYDRGTAAFKAGEYNEAEDSFRQALQTPDLDLQERTYYNMGDTLFKHGEALQKVDSKKTRSLWEQSLHSFDSALKLKKSADSQKNYDLVKRKLEELKKQQQQQQQQKNQGNSSDPNQQDQSGNNSQQQDQNQNQGGQGNQQQQNQQGGQDQKPGGQKNSQDPSQNNGQDQKPDSQGDGQDKSASSPKTDKNSRSRPTPARATWTSRTPASSRARTPRICSIP